MLSGDDEGVRDVRCLHESKSEDDTGEGLADRLETRAFGQINTWGWRNLHRKDDVLLMQHLVMLEAVHERGWRAGRIAGEEYRRARHPMRRLLFQHRHQFVERHLALSRFLEQQPAAAA